MKSGVMARYDDIKKIDNEDSLGGGRDNQIGQWSVSGAINRMTDDIDGLFASILDPGSRLMGFSSRRWRCFVFRDNGHGGGKFLEDEDNGC